MGLEHLTTKTLIVDAKNHAFPGFEPKTRSQTTFPTTWEKGQEKKMKDKMKLVMVSKVIKYSIHL